MYGVVSVIISSGAITVSACVVRIRFFGYKFSVCKRSLNHNHTGFGIIELAVTTVQSLQKTSLVEQYSLGIVLLALSLIDVQMKLPVIEEGAIVRRVIISAQVDFY